jgi:hypothetical protein
MDDTKTFDELSFCFDRVVGTTLEGFYEFKIILRLPPKRTYFHEEICKLALIFPFCHLGEVAE